MLNLLTAIRTKISGSALSSDVGDRIFADEYPPSYGAPVFPYVIYFIVSDVPDNVFNKTGEEVLLQFSLFSSAEGLTEITTMFTDLKALFDDAQLTVTSSTMIVMKRENLTTMVEEIETTAGTQKVKHWAVDYSIQLQAS